MAEDKKTSSKAEDLGDDLDGLQLAINEKSDDTLECTRRMREMCAEAKDSGMKTLIAWMTRHGGLWGLIMMILMSL